jgi:hypothetical protein
MGRGSSQHDIAALPRFDISDVERTGLDAFVEHGDYEASILIYSLLADTTASAVHSRAYAVLASESALGTFASYQTSEGKHYRPEPGQPTRWAIPATLRFDNTNEARVQRQLATINRDIQANYSLVLDLISLNAAS